MSGLPRAILLSGSVGTGKTTVMLEIGELLDAAGEPHALIDADWLAWVSLPAGSPLAVHDLLVRNLAAVARCFAEAGVHHLVLARFVQTQAELAAVHGALGDYELVSVRLAAPRDLVEQRLRRRDSGAELEEHLALAAVAAGIAGFEDAVVANDDRDPRDVARDVLAAAGWPLGAD